MHPRMRLVQRCVFMTTSAPANVCPQGCFCALVSPTCDMKLTVLRPASLPSAFSPQRKSRRYYPTRLAITLATGVTGSSLHTPAPGSGPGSADSGFIVVETNYRIYAYTSKSDHQPANACWTRQRWREGGTREGSQCVHTEEGRGMEDDGWVAGGGWMREDDDGWMDEGGKGWRVGWMMDGGKDDGRMEDGWRLDG